MLNKEIKTQLKSYSRGDIEPLKKFFDEVFVSSSFSESDMKELLTDCAMIAAKYGLVENIQFLVSKNKSILSGKESGIFRMTTDIESFDNFVTVIDYLLSDDNQQYIDINANHSAFVKECINKNKLNHLKYMMEEKKVVFSLDNIVVKTLIKNADENREMFDYLLVQLKTTIKDSASLQSWIVENNYEEQWNQITKKNLLLHLENKLTSNTPHLMMKAKKI